MAQVRDAVRFAAERLGEQNSHVAPLVAACRDDGAEAFVAACDGLHEPEIRFKEGVRAMYDSLKDRVKDDADGRGVGDATRVWARLETTLLAESRPGVGTLVGARNATFAKTTFKKHCAQKAKDLEALLERAKTSTGDREKLLKRLKELLSIATQIVKSLPLRPGAVHICEYSTYLRDYDGRRPLAVPGGLASPGAAVACFEPTLLALSSKQRPKRLTLRATDASKHDYLVKGGEDLRTDERIQQLFEARSRVSRRSLSRRGPRVRDGEETTPSVHPP